MSVLLGVAHGSRDDRSQQGVEDLLAAAAAKRPGLQVRAAYLDNASPSVRVALEQLAPETDVTVLPLLLAAASHSKTDLPGSLQLGRLEHPGLTIRYGRPLGPHPVLVEGLAQRLGEAGATDLPVLVVASGSLDPDANASLAATARLLFEGRSFPSVDYAFVATTPPGVTQGLERLRAQGCTRVAVAPYFLGPGFLPRLTASQARTVDGLEVVVAEPLGATEGLVDLVLERYDEALAGDVRMNCDACLYRIAFPGRETAVGAPQQPHAHPDDPTS